WSPTTDRATAPAPLGPRSTATIPSCATSGPGSDPRRPTESSSGSSKPSNTSTSTAPPSTTATPSRWKSRDPARSTTPSDPTNPSATKPHDTRIYTPRPTNRRHTHQQPETQHVNAELSRAKVLTQHTGRFTG